MLCDGEWVDEDEDEFRDEIEHMDDLRDPKDDEGEDGGVCQSKWPSPVFTSTKTCKRNFRNDKSKTLKFIINN